MTDEGLTPAQEDYFRILEALHPDRDLRLSIARAKETLRRWALNARGQIPS